MISGKRIDQEECGISLANEHAKEIMRVLESHEEDGWRYRLENDPMDSTRSFILVFDEEGGFLGKL